ncbi:hypothetical protein BRSPCE3_63410 [Bradyrhizobium sp. Ce-3]|nr:hypothetical protein BRSPCE3_63410 [Bradyrhizobium sp. Ce-3]
MVSRCREGGAGRNDRAQQVFTTRADFAVDSAPAPVTSEGSHGNVIKE